MTAAHFSSYLVNFIYHTEDLVYMGNEVLTHFFALYKFLKLQFKNVWTLSKYHIEFQSKKNEITGFVFFL